MQTAPSPQELASQLVRNPSEIVLKHFQTSACKRRDMLEIICMVFIFTSLCVCTLYNVHDSTVESPLVTNLVIEARSVAGLIALDSTTVRKLSYSNLHIEFSIVQLNFRILEPFAFRNFIQINNFLSKTTATYSSTLIVFDRL